MKKSVNTIIKNSAGKYLLQVRDGTAGICNPLKWNCFGGGMAEGEEPAPAAVRETIEELGVKTQSADFELLGELRTAKDKLVYVVRYNKPLEWADIHVNEGAGAGFFTKEETLRIDITDTTRSLVEKYF